MTLPAIDIIYFYVQSSGKQRSDNEATVVCTVSIDWAPQSSVADKAQHNKDITTLDLTPQTVTISRSEWHDKPLRPSFFLD